LFLEEKLQARLQQQKIVSSCIPFINAWLKAIEKAAYQVPNWNYCITVVIDHGF
jgi:hypothetical protein